MLGLSLLSIIVLGVLPTSISASTTYQLTLAKSTNEFVVGLYNDAEWKTTVDPSFTPIDWFGGDANVTNAKSKVTLKGWTTNTWRVYDVLTSIVMPEYFNIFEIGLILTVIGTQGYNETTINESYNNNFSSWFGLRAVWSYTTKTFEENPNSNDGVIVFQDPLDVKTMLDDYNALAAEFNVNPIINMSVLFPIVNADDFLWQLIFNGLAIAEPQNSYLDSLVTELGCENTTISGSTLIIERYGLTNYSVEISYGEKGMMSSFTVKNVDGDIIYRITSSNSDWLFYLILISVVVFSIAIITFIIIRNKKLKR